MLERPSRLTGNILDALPEALPILETDTLSRFVTNAFDPGAPERDEMERRAGTLDGQLDDLEPFA
jgi:hypothetical protein